MSIRDRFDHRSGFFVASGDARIYVEEKGDPAAPALLLLHGGLGQMEDFNTITPALAGKFRLVGVDSRGHGRSTLGRNGLSYATLEDDLARIIDTLKLERFSILGFSDGGITACRYAARGDARLEKIVTVGASWEMSATDPAWELLSSMTARDWTEMFPESCADYQRLNPEPDFDRLVARAVEMWTDLGEGGYPGKRMAETAAPLLMVRGDLDPLTSLESMAGLQALRPDVHVLNIPFAEHAAFAESPEIFLRAAEMFFTPKPDAQR